jgi:xylulose-5-phosphate/fructose-6-phosphate phosphoketolase
VHDGAVLPVLHLNGYKIANPTVLSRVPEGELDALLRESRHPHGLPDAESDALLTRDRPVVFAYHGYPWLIHRIAHRTGLHDRLHVRGYRESGATTTPFDMVVRNDLDRYRLVMDVIDRVPGLAARAAGLRRSMQDVRDRHHDWIREHGTDLPEVADWHWPG